MTAWLHWLDAWLYQLLTHSWEHYWPLLAIMLGLHLFERLFPHEEHAPWQAFRFNLLYPLLTIMFLFAISSELWGGIGTALNGLVPGPLIPLAAGDSFPGEAARVLLVVLIGDFAMYWAHRLMHASPFFWAIHRMHHDERHLHAATGFRQHWLNIPFIHVVLAPPLIWLVGAQSPPAQIGLLIGIQQAFQHANLRIHFGPLNRVISTPQWHRIHHAIDPRLHNRNFSMVFPIWDILFGTYREPIPGEHLPPGLQDTPESISLVKAFFQPFGDWWQLASKRWGVKATDSIS